VDERFATNKRHAFEQKIGQRVYPIAAGYEDCNDAVHLRIDPALSLALDKGHHYRAIFGCKHLGGMSMKILAKIGQVRYFQI
jgi:hypothetical protein